MLPDRRTRVLRGQTPTGGFSYLDEARFSQVARDAEAPFFHSHPQENRSPVTPAPPNPEAWGTLSAEPGSGGTSTGAWDRCPKATAAGCQHRQLAPPRHRPRGLKPKPLVGPAAPLQHGSQAPTHAEPNILRCHQTFSPSGIRPWHARRTTPARTGTRSAARTPVAR